jgi:DNA-directed RNA polymerase subunit RPC12/RpoP
MFDEEKPKPEKKNPPVPEIETTPPPVVTKPIVTSAEPIHNAVLLPATCSQCGAPVSPYEVKWRGKQSAACPYCGSNLKMKNG